MQKAASKNVESSQKLYAKISLVRTDVHVCRNFHTHELGKVDKGGGGTVAKYFSRLGMEVIDLGPPVLSMHSPYEVTSKVDIYSSYMAYKAFLSN